MRRRRAPLSLAAFAEMEAEEDDIESSDGEERRRAPAPVQRRRRAAVPVEMKQDEDHLPNAELQGYTGVPFRHQEWMYRAPPRLVDNDDGMEGVAPAAVAPEDENAFDRAARELADVLNIEAGDVPIPQIAADTIPNSDGMTAEGDYCFLCKTALDPDNIYRKTMLDILKPLEEADMYVLCNLVAQYYQATCFPVTRKEQTAYSFFRHVHLHQVHPLHLFTENIKTLTAQRDRYASAAERVDSNNQPLPPDPVHVKMMLSVISAQEKSILRLLQLKRMNHQE